MVVNVLAAAGDVLIAAVLCKMLHTSRTGYKKYIPIRRVLCARLMTIPRSDTMINKLIVFIVNTGLLTR